MTLTEAIAVSAAHSCAEGLCSSAVTRLVRFKAPGMPPSDELGLCSLHAAEARELARGSGLTTLTEVLS